MSGLGPLALSSRNGAFDVQETRLRSPDYVEALKDLDRAGFAWEFLRRNPAYREDYDRIDEDPEEPELSPERMGGNWGLSFRLRPVANCVSHTGIMAA